MIKDRSNLKLISLCITLLSFPNYTYSQDCVLPNGKYTIQYDKEFSIYPKMEFQIKNDSILFLEKEKGEIIWRFLEQNSDCTLLVEKDKVNEDELTILQKMLHKRNPYYEFKKLNKNKYEFIYRVDLHITINSGKFIKQ